MDLQHLGILLSSRIMPEAVSPLALGQINIVVRDMAKSLAFYRLLGLAIEEIPLAEWAPHHASGVTSNGVHVDFDSLAFAKQWNPGLDEAKLGSAAIPFFHVSSRDEVSDASSSLKSCRAGRCSDRAAQVGSHPLQRD